MRHTANILLKSSFFINANRITSKWQCFIRPPTVAWTPYCLWTNVLWTFSGPRIKCSCFIIFGAFWFGGYVGTFGTVGNFRRRNSGSSISWVKKRIDLILELSVKLENHRSYRSSIYDRKWEVVSNILFLWFPFSRAWVECLKHRKKVCDYNEMLNYWWK